MIFFLFFSSHLSHPFTSMYIASLYRIANRRYHLVNLPVFLLHFSLSLILSAMPRFLNSLPACSLSKSPQRRGLRVPDTIRGEPSLVVQNTDGALNRRPLSEQLDQGPLRALLRRCRSGRRQASMANSIILLAHRWDTVQCFIDLRSLLSLCSVIRIIV